MKKFIALGAAASVLMTGCVGGIVSSGPAVAEVTLQPTRGNAVTGHISFTESGSKLRVMAEVSGLTPGPHGFHIHEKGDCSAPDAMSAGGHFNPFKKMHGNPEHGDHHGGDMPQLVADANGVAKLLAYIDAVEITEGAAGILGRSVIVHVAADDFTTQPTGNSGARVACGVIVKKSS